MSTIPNISTSHTIPNYITPTFADEKGNGVKDDLIYAIETLCEQIETTGKYDPQAALDLMSKIEPYFTYLSDTYGRVLYVSIVTDMRREIGGGKPPNASKLLQNLQGLANDIANSNIPNSATNITSSAKANNPLAARAAEALLV